jgi:hypothetical protein
MVELAEVALVDMAQALAVKVELMVILVDMTQVMEALEVVLLGVLQA